MKFINKLHETYEFLHKLDELILSKGNNHNIKKCLSSISEDLAKYKDIDENSIRIENDDVISKITDVLNRINDIETNVRNKLVITEKYNSYLKS